MSTKDILHRIVEELPEAQAELALEWLEDLREANDLEGRPLDEESLASLDRGLDDISTGRMTQLEEYQRKRGL